jgi:Asp-tRNA(Asn)/Glu-tRNA(Gln) amidotransferase A subunit family amidase
MSSSSSVTASAAFINTQATGNVRHSKGNTGGSQSDIGPLSNMRLAVKDLFHIQGIETSAGNPSWQSTHPIPNMTNTSVNTLLNMGTRYIGKTLTDELAYSLNGQNIHYPKLTNPITPNRLVGGSSSGSAAAVASDLADIGLGTDTGGSIRVPASYTGLYGLRTTHGAIPCDNMVALAKSFDTIGWMCKRIDTLYKVAQALLPFEQLSSMQNIDILNDDTSTKIYVATNLVENSEQASDINSWLNTLTDTTIKYCSFDVDDLHCSETFRILQGYEIWQEHGQWITQEQPTFADDVDQRFIWCKSLSSKQQHEALQQQTAINQRIDAIFQDHNLMLVPTTPGRAPLTTLAAANMATYREDLMGITAIAGLSGRPQIHLPLFAIEGAPCGLSLIGSRNCDLLLVRLANALINKSKMSIDGTKVEHTL